MNKSNQNKKINAVKKKSGEKSRKNSQKSSAKNNAATLNAVKKAVKKARKLPTAVLIAIAVIIIIAVIALYFTGTLTTAVDYLITYVFNNAPSDNLNNDGLTAAEGDLLIHINDVGQGDNILIELPDGKKMVIDGGDRFNDIKDDAIDYITSRCQTLDYVILTHTDSDHCGSLNDIIESVENIKKIYLPKIKTGDSELNAELGLSDSAVEDVITAVYQDFVTAALDADYDEDGISKEADRIFLLDEIVIDGGSYRFTMYCADSIYYDTMSDDSHDINDVSPICVLEYAGRKAVFTGDANYSAISSSAEKRFMETMSSKGYSNYDCDILKVAHHGGKDSSGADFLNFISAEYAIISVGNDSGDNSTGNYSGYVSDAYYRAGYTLTTCGNGKYDHPHRNVAGVPVNGEGRLASSGVLELYRTDLNGDTVVTISDDGAISIDTAKTASVEGNTIVYINIAFNADCTTEIYVTMYYEERLRTF